jgi:hypothetical protein
LSFSLNCSLQHSRDSLFIEVLTNHAGSNLAQHRTALRVSIQCADQIGKAGRISGNGRGQRVRQREALRRNWSHHARHTGRKGFQHLSFNAGSVA